jgi:RNA binding exosome subunit
MKSHKYIILAILIAFSSTYTLQAHAGFGDFLKKVGGAVGLSGELSESKIVQGLKEALEIGTNNAVKTVSKTDGYYQNPSIKIPLPDAVKKVEKVLRTVGYGQKVDDFELSMNRAAEQAAPEAKALFWDTIKQMSIADARKILDGRDNEATLYFKEKTEDRLSQTFKPIVHSAMSKVGVTRSYQELDAKVRSIPFTESLSFDLDKYVTNGALDGLFLMLADEERKIRQNPAARVTDLLKEVFGSQR